MCAFPNHTHSIEFATGYLHSKCSNIYKQYKILLISNLNSTVPDKGMNTYAMESFKFLMFNKLAKMLKTCLLLYHYGVWSVDWCGEKSNLKQFNIRQQHNKMWKK